MMMLSTPFLQLLAVLVSVGVSSATPTSKKPQAVGALYVLSNHPEGNTILSHNVLQDGTLSFASGTTAGGMGSHVNSTGPDPLQSQGPLRVVGNRLYALNTGSRTVVMFNINPSNPTRLTMIGKPVDTQGDFPNTLAVSPTNGNVCVANSGPRNNVACFQNTPRGLLPLGSPRSLHIPFSGNPPTPVNTFSDLTFSPDGSKLLVSFKPGDNATGYVATWNVLPNGSLSSNAVKTFPTDGGRSPFGMSFLAGFKDVVLNADLSFGFTIYDFRKGYDKGVGHSTEIPDFGNPCWTTYSPALKNYFISDGITGVVTEVNIDKKLNEKILKQYTVQGRTFDQDVVSIGSKDYYYVLEPLNGGVEVLSLPAPASAKSIQLFNSTVPALKAGIKVDLRYLTGLASWVKAGGY